MAPWEFHENFPCFNVRRIEGYRYYMPLAWRLNVLKFDNEPLHATQHILSFFEYVWKLGVTHEDILIRLLFCSLDERKRAWVKVALLLEQYHLVGILLKSFSSVRILL
jgi:hypothetical protein